MSQVEKIAAPTVGTAIAYFLVLWAVMLGWIPDDNQAEAVAMGGAVVTFLLLQLGAFFRWAGRLIERAVNGPPPPPPP